MAHKPPPADWPQLSTCMFYRDAPAAIDWLCKAFGFEVRIRVDDDSDPGKIVHSELVYGKALIMVDSRVAPDDPVPPGEEWRRTYASPLDLGGRGTQSLFMYVDDVDAHCAQARAHGARIVIEPKVSDYGPEYWSDRGYSALDCEGHFWSFAHRLRG